MEVAGSASRVELVRVRLGAGPAVAVADVLRAVRDDARPFALVGRWAGSRAVVGSEPVRSVEGAEVLDVIDQRPVAAPAGVVGGGWFGYLGFGLGAAIEALPPPPPRPRPMPVASMAYYDHVLRQDAAGVWWFEALRAPGREQALERRLADLRDRLALAHAQAQAPAPPRPYRLGELAPAPGATARHTAAVAACVERIAAGELFQANLCLRLEARFEGSAADAFLAAAELLQPAYGAFVAHPGGAVLSFSPELFLRRREDRVTTSPIKGTAPRPPEPPGATAQRAALLASAKDAAEHVMIVDLARNDLGRIARYGTVEAHARRVEPHPGLWHLVTDVLARVRDATGDADVVRAAFPPGSVTGAPKIQSLKVIADLEGTQREVYTGAIGYVSPVAGMELNVAIRTLETSGARAWLGCGGGIVADSDPHAELEEALAKAAPIAAALGARVHADRPGRSTPPPQPPWPRRPDPAKGLLETIAVRDGRPVDAERHLERLAASARTLYGLELPDDLQLQPTLAHTRLRVLARPTRHGLDVAIEEAPADDEPIAVALEPRGLSGGLGAHKWLDRPQQRHQLVVDLDGSVLEAAWANVWILTDGVLVTPPDDGRLLPGVTRARLLAAGDVATAQAQLSLEDLATAEAVLLTSSVRLVTPAALHPHEPAARAIELAARLRQHGAISTNTGSYIR